jgi:hypothetical protein
MSIVIVHQACQIAMPMSMTGTAGIPTPQIGGASLR